MPIPPAMEDTPSPIAPASRPSLWWGSVAALLAVVSAALLVAALAYQQAADRPVGEGELFLGETTTAAEMVEAGRVAGEPAATTVRKIRNELTIEAVALVDEAGMVTAATSAPMAGRPITNGLLAFSLSKGRFAAVAAPVEDGVRIDGIEEWPDGSVLYQVMRPLPEGGGVLLMYDVQELLERRARSNGVRSLTIQLGGAAMVLLLTAAAVLFGRARAAQRFREVSRESDLLRRHAEELHQRNLQLDEARAAAEAALALAEEKNRIRSEFVLMINHELRTPLTSIVTGAELLMNEELLDAGERQRLVRDMIHDGKRLQTMISQMLAVARIENRGLNYELRDVPIADACDEVERCHSKIRVDHAPHVTDEMVESVHLHTDPQTLAQLVASLTDNAFTHGATDVEVTCDTELRFEPMLEVGIRPEAAAFFSVRDNGPGIDSEFLPRAFEKFEKKSWSSGTGLGLYMAKMMVEAIGGSLAVTTGPDGTTFTVAVPLQPAGDRAGVRA